MLLSSLDLKHITMLCVSMRLSKPVSAEDIKEVYSHPQALAQCKDYIKNMALKLIMK